MGPATFQHSGRIVSEICRQFPDFANYFTKTRSNSDDVASTRRWYSNISLSCNVKSELNSRSPIAEFAAHFEKACTRRNTEKISMTMKNSHALERMDNKNRSTKKDGKQLNMTSSEQTMKKKSFKDNENRAAMQRCDRKRIEARKCNESKIIEKTTTKVEKRSSNVEKSKNWTIPAALSDKKPKMLYGLVRQRRKPLTNFFSRFFEVRNNDLADDYYSKLSGWKIDRIDCAANQKALKESSRDKSRRKWSCRENRSNVSTSVSDLAAGSLEGTESSMIVENSRSLEQLENRTIARRSAESSSRDIIEGRVTTTSNSESEIETSENESTQKISSKIALFLENLKINGQRSHSLSSLVSYNLESLFTDVEVAPILKHPTPTSILFSSSDSDCKLSIKDKLKKICGKKKSRKEDEICKKRKCKGMDAAKSCGKKNEPPACKKRDECKKQPTCDKDVEDPCKPCRSEEHHGPTCKKYKEESKYDPCDKLWNDETHGQRCKKQQKKKKTTTDTCCQKKEESYDTKKKEKPKKSEKAKCPPVVRAPGCPQDDDKSGGTGRGSFRRYSTFDSKINANNDSDYKDIRKTDESNDVSINSQRSRQEKTRKVGLLDSNAFDVSCRYRNENFRNY